MGPRTVLVVEDNPRTRANVCAALTGRGHHVLAAPDARTALELAERHPPDLVLQALVLPDSDGVALAAELRKRAQVSQRRIAVLAFTGFTTPRDELRLAADGFDDVILKPIEPARLVPLVEAHLPGHMLSRERFGLGRRLIVADDDPSQLKLSRFHLEKLGFSVITACDGEEALVLAKRDRPDAILSDVLMPKLDGFALALAVRAAAELRGVPVILVTSNFVEASDRELARRAGAHDLLLRTPGHQEIVEALRDTFGSPSPPVELSLGELSGFEKEHTRRLIQQLERQVALNAALARRAAALSAELGVLTSISQAVLREENIERALDDALAACLDAGGVPFGALYFLDDHAGLRVRPLGSKRAWGEAELATFFGHEETLRELMGRGALVTWLSSRLDGAHATAAREVLRRCEAESALVVPLVHGGRPLGALFMAGESAALGEDDWTVFVQGVANQLAQALAVARAFAEREAAERRARHQERLARDQSELLGLILDQAPDLITRLDARGLVTFVNRDAPGGSREELVGKPWLSQLEAREQDRLARALETALHGGETSSYETSLTSADGQTDWYAGRIGPLLSEGKVTGAVVVSRLVTREKEREAQLMVADRMSSVGTLAAGMAHEINNPLAAVISNVDLAREEVARLGAGTASECLRDALEAAERIRAIVHDLKLFSRMHDEAKRPIDVPAVLDATLRLASNELRHRARVVRDLQPVPLVEGSDARLGQAFLNLLINAAQAIPEGRADENEIRVSTRLEEGRVVVTISDSGAGMGEEVQRRLFSPFFTTKPTGVGTGLGLSLCHRIVSGMGGEIRVRSEEGMGSTFTVVLPASRPVASRVPPEIAPPHAAVRSGRVLIVDDDRIVLSSLRRALGGQHEVHEVASAGEALALVRGGACFDVILCDLMMPQMTGMDLHAALAASHPDQARRMVFLTGGAFTARAAAFLASTANLTLEKPYDVQRLRTIVNERIR